MPSTLQVTPRFCGSPLTWRELLALRSNHDRSPLGSDTHRYVLRDIDRECGRIAGRTSRGITDYDLEGRAVICRCRGRSGVIPDVAPLIAESFFCHWYAKGELPFAVTVKVAG